MSRFIVAERSAFPYVWLNLYFGGGAPHDPPALQGLTTLTNRALLRGTAKRGRARLEEDIEILGSEVITATRNQAVSLGGAVLSRHLDAWLALVGEMLLEPRLEPTEIDKVKREMAAELESAVDHDGTVARVWFRRAIYGDHPYGHGPSGTPRTLAAITPATVAEQARRVYCRGNLLVGASGDITRAALTERIDAVLASLPEGAPIGWDFAPPPTHRGRRVVLIDRPGRTQAQLLIGHPGVAAGHPAYFPLHIALTAFGGTFSSRLMQAVRVERGWSYGAHARMSCERGRGLFLMSAAPAMEKVVDCLGLICDEYTRFVEAGLADDEVAFARDHLARAFPFSIETPALQVAQRVRARLLGHADDYVDRYLAGLAAPDPQAIRVAVQAELRPADLTMVVVGAVDAALEAAVAKIPGVTRVDRYAAADTLSWAG